MAMHPLEVPGKGLFQGFLLASGDLLSIFGVPWHTDASPRFLPSRSHRVLPVCVSASKSPFNKDSSHIGLRTTPPQYNLI